MLWIFISKYSYLITACNLAFQFPINATVMFYWILKRYRNSVLDRGQPAAQKLEENLSKAADAKKKIKQ